MKYKFSKEQYEFLRGQMTLVNGLVPEAQAVTLNASEKDDLILKKYMDKQQKLSEEIRDAFEMICNPAAVQRQRMTNMHMATEQVLYAGQKEGVVCVTETATGVLVESDYSNEEDLEGLGQYLGNSLVKSSSVELNLPTREAFVLAGVWDGIRQANLKNAFKDDVVEKIESNVLVDLLQNVETSQCLSYYIKALNALAMSEAEIKTALSALEKKGHVKVSGEVELTGTTFEICLNFKSIKNMLQISTACGDGETTYGNEIMVLQDGVMDLLLMEIGAENVQFLSVSSLGVLSLLESFYQNPKTYMQALYEKRAASESVPAAGGDAKFCSNCGAKRAEGAKFCPECGGKF